MRMARTPHPASWLAAAFATATLLPSQAPLLRFQPTANPGQTLQTLLLGGPAQGFATLLAPQGEPSVVLGEALWLSPVSSAVLIDSGLLDAIGMRALALQTPNLVGLIGRPLFAQSLVLDPSAGNGTFRASNGQSAFLHGKTAAVVFEFRDAVAEGVVGDYDGNVKERLMAAPITRRTRTLAPVQGTPFNQALVTPLSTKNGRLQHVYRAVDLAASGAPEFVTALRWKPFGPVVADSFARVHITLGHTPVVPDYTIDPITWLPKFPGSGLKTIYATNYKPQDTTQIVCDAPYSIQPAALQPDGFLAWPSVQTPFRYNGVDSLLVDYRVVASAATSGSNGFATRLMVMSASEPNSRVYAPGFQQGPIDPFAITNAHGGDNAFYDLQVDLVRASSFALTKWTKTPGPMLRYFDAMIAAALPSGTSMLLSYEGAMDASGGGYAGSSPSPSFINGYPWMRVRIELVANPLTGARPSIDTLVIPVD